MPSRRQKIPPAWYSSCWNMGMPADVNMTGTLAAEVMVKATEKAITSSTMDDDEYLSYCL
ncbi:hypothetical protein SELR_pSRC101310 (plasmid) [Selenomonas ruminantium subsp. lactilytica TAM6421]|uniref:Uncharacterized protein n=1 Tax=Selenomonas ruminantium subsp. lactilytica (strain NBRC 103574 / TAM6421) TaxID=927704 RepID=I0GW01_SELRL|nr:hypothetical protein SELR_pSRC101310 [Selenomonas ruminantium subsp. lactilytica TAM6421]